MIIIIIIIIVDCCSVLMLCFERVAGEEFVQGCATAMRNRQT